MKRFQYIALVGLLVLLASSVIPWITFSIPILGKIDFNLLDFFRYTSDISREAKGSLGSSLLLLSMLLYGVSIVLGFIGMLNKKLCTTAGIMAVLSGILFYAAISTIRSEATRQPSGWLVVGLINAGIGPAIAIIGGIIILLAPAIRDF
jgi:hypothetical protein